SCSDTWSTWFYPPSLHDALPIWVVEGEVPRRQLLHREAVVGAGEILAEELLVALTFVGGDEYEPIGQFRCGFDRFAHPTNGRGFNGQPVDIDFNVVFLVLLEGDLFVELVEIAINPNSTEAGLSGFGKDVLKLAFSTAHDRRHNSDSTPLRHLENPVGDLLGCLPRDLVPADRAVRLAAPRPYQ